MATIRSPKKMAILITLLSGCQAAVGEEMDRNSPAGVHEADPIILNNAALVRDRIAKELRVGSTDREIEAFLDRHRIGFVWNEISEQYEAIIRNVEPFHSITIDVYVNGQRRFVRAEVNDSYTAPLVAVQRGAPKCLNS
jgi:hypothetical protein